MLAQTCVGSAAAALFSREPASKLLSAICSSAGVPNRQELCSKIPRSMSPYERHEEAHSKGLGTVERGASAWDPVPPQKDIGRVLQQMASDESANVPEECRAGPQHAQHTRGGQDSAGGLLRPLSPRLLCGQQTRSHGCVKHGLQACRAGGHDLRVAWRAGSRSGAAESHRRASSSSQRPHGSHWHGWPSLAAARGAQPAGQLNTDHAAGLLGCARGEQRWLRPPARCQARHSACRRGSRPPQSSQALTADRSRKFGNSSSSSTQHWAEINKTAIGCCTDAVAMQHPYVSPLLLLPLPACACR